MSKLISELTPASSPAYIDADDLIPISRDGSTYRSYINYGTAANNTVRLDGSGALPAVSSGATIVTNPTQEIQDSLNATLEDIYSISSNNYVSVLEYGAIGDGFTDDTDSIQDAIDAAAILKKSVYFPIPDVAYSCGTLTIPDNMTLFGDGYASVIRQDITPSNGQGLLFINSGSSSTQIENVNVLNLCLEGLVSTLGFSEFKHLISFNGVNNVNISECLISGFRGDGIYIGSGDAGGTERHNTNVNIFNNTIDGINQDNRNGISVIDGKNITIFNNEILNSTRTNMPGAIDLEPDDDYNIIQNIRIVNNNIENCRGNVGIVGVVLTSAIYTTPPRDILVYGNTYNCPTTPGLVQALYYNQSYTDNLRITIAANSGVSSRPFAFTQHVYGVTIVSNNFYATNAGLLGFNAATDFVKYLIMDDNTFEGNGTNEAIVFKNGSNVGIGSNAFNGFTTGIAIGDAAATITNFIASNNIFDNTPNANTYTTGATLSSCRWINNIGGVNNFPAPSDYYSGGTNATTAQGAINNLAGAVTSGSYLRGNGTNVVMNTIQVSDVPTLNQNTTGTAANISSGSANQMLYQSGSNATAKLAVNATATSMFLHQVSSGAPTWLQAQTSDLSDYVTGTFTPTLNSWTNVGSPTVSGTYIKIGSLVYYRIRIIPSTSISATLSTSTITGLPYGSATADQLTQVVLTAATSQGSAIVAATTVFPQTTGVITNTLLLSGVISVI